MYQPVDSRRAIKGFFIIGTNQRTDNLPALNAVNRRRFRADAPIQGFEFIPYMGDMVFQGLNLLERVAFIIKTAGNFSPFFPEFRQILRQGAGLSPLLFNIRA